MILTGTSTISVLGDNAEQGGTGVYLGSNIVFIKLLYGKAHIGKPCEKILKKCLSCFHLLGNLLRRSCLAYFRPNFRSATRYRFSIQPLTAPAAVHAGTCREPDRSKRSR